jgi:4-amino-4-deoxy-L-arabinose transferase-like glycosyltransferase
VSPPPGNASSPSGLAIEDIAPPRAVPRYRLRAALLILVATVFYALLGRIALQGYPFSGDEYSTLLQAEGFARGALKARAPPYADWAAVDHVVIDEFVRSKYPPGTAALLSLGVRAGAPWLVTPLEGLLALVVFWFAARVVFDERRAFLAVAFLAAAPLFAYQSATFLSHTPTLLFAALGTLAVALWTRSRRDGYLLLFGLCVGCVFLIRPVDGALLGLSLVALGSLRALVIAGASSLPFVGLDLWYNKLQFGSPFTDGYTAYIPDFVAIYGESGAASNMHPLHLVSPIQVFHHLAEFETLFFQWTVPGTALLACLGWVALRREQAGGEKRTGTLQRFFGVMLALFVAAVLVTFNEPDDSPRPRYLSMVLLPLAFLAAAGWDGAAAFVKKQLGRRTAWVVGLAVWIAPAYLIASYLERRVPEVNVHTGLREELARQHVRSGVVIVRAEWPTRYARNGMFFDNPPVLLSVPATVSAAEVAARFPGQEVHEAFEPHGSNPWKHPWVIRRVQ